MMRTSLCMGDDPNGNPHRRSRPAAVGKHESMRDRVVAGDRQFVEIERIVFHAVEHHSELRSFVGGALTENVPQRFSLMPRNLAERNSPFDVDLASLDFGTARVGGLELAFAGFFPCGFRAEVSDFDPTLAGLGIWRSLFSAHANRPDQGAISDRLKREGDPTRRRRIVTSIMVCFADICTRNPQKTQSNPRWWLVAERKRCVRLILDRVKYYITSSHTVLYAPSSSK